jgi:hypothetical protein
MSLRRLLHSNTMRSSASDYFIYDQPAQFLVRAAQAAGFLWLSTIICAEPEATVVEDDYRGRFFGEPIEHPVSGVNPQSFQPACSCRQLAENIFNL